MTAHALPVLVDGLTPEDAAELEEARSLLWRDCKGGIKPFCPFAACRHHLLFQVTPNGRRIAFNHEREVDRGDGWTKRVPVDDPSQLQWSCSLEEAAAGRKAGGMTLEEVGRRLGLTRERVRQIEVEALVKLRRGTRDRGTATRGDDE